MFSNVSVFVSDDAAVLKIFCQFFVGFNFPERRFPGVCRVRKGFSKAGMIRSEKDVGLGFF